jgi:hypothetical protein
VGDRRRPTAVAAAARGKRLGGRRLGQHVTSGGALGLVKLVEWLAGGESERCCKVPSAAAMAGWRLGGAWRGRRTALK